MEREVFDKKIIQEAQLKLAEKRAKQNEIDTIKGSVKMISDALILLNNKMETLKNSNLKNMEEAIVNFEEITDYHDKKIENYDNKFNIIKRKINSFNDVAEDILEKIKSACEVLEVDSIQEISAKTKDYADFIKNKFDEISSEFDSFNDVQIKMEQIKNQVNNIEEFNICGKINSLSESIEKIQNFTEAFEGNISHIESKISDTGLIEKVNKRINSFDKVYESVDSILEKTKSISDNAELAEITLNNICKYNEEQNNNIEEIIQNKFSLLSEIIVEISERILNEKSNLEGFVNTRYDNINKVLNEIISYNEENRRKIHDVIEINSKNIISDIKNRVDESNTNTIKNIIDLKCKVEENFKNSETHIEEVSKVLSNTLNGIESNKNEIEEIIKNNQEHIIENFEEKFSENENNTNKFIEEFKYKYDILDKLINKIQNDSVENADYIKSTLGNNHKDIVDILNKMSNSQVENINKVNDLLIDNFSDILQKIHDTVYGNEKRYSSIIEKTDQLSESLSVLDKSVNENIKNNFNEVYDKLNLLINDNIELKEYEEQRDKNLSEEFQKLSSDAALNFKDITKKVDELYIEIPKRVQSDFKEIFLEMDEKLNNLLDKQYVKIEESIEKINSNFINREDFNKKFHDNFEKMNRLDDKICELEQKINDLLEENRQLKETINKNNQIITQPTNNNNNNNSQFAGTNDSINMLEKAAKSGDSKACLQMGDMYYKGLNTNQDFEKALKYYEIGSMNGSVECNTRIMGIYKILADKGFMEYQFLIGKSYLEGKIVGQDIDIALEWYKKAAKNGHGEAKTVLIRMYMMMANNNNADGLFNLGICYYEGFCVEKDLAKAYEYLNKAASLGHGEAIKMVSRP